jgi:hypothetical protein
MEVRLNLLASQLAAGARRNEQNLTRILALWTRIL